MDPDSLRKIIRTVKNWPKEGVNFYDICSILERPEAFAWTVEKLIQICLEKRVEALVSPDARGFIWGSAVAFALRLPLHLARKPGKLPGEVFTESYEYEYSSSSISMQTGCELEGKRVMLIDDVLATGGTALAILKLLKSRFEIPAEHLCLSAVINLEFLGGRQRLQEKGVRVDALLNFNE
jgi:adenine phosphoribosyltransferase